MAPRTASLMREVDGGAGVSAALTIATVVTLIMIVLEVAGLAVVNNGLKASASRAGELAATGQTLDPAGEETPLRAFCAGGDVTFTTACHVDLPDYAASGGIACSSPAASVVSVEARCTWTFLTPIPGTLLGGNALELEAWTVQPLE